MRRIRSLCLPVFVGIAGVGILIVQTAFSREDVVEAEQEKIARLPAPKLQGAMSLEEAIKKRRCVRKFKDKPLALEQLSQLLWAANGVTGRDVRFRAAPSAGALHPLDFYAVVGKDSVPGLDAGVWHYNPEEHTISLGAKGDLRDALKDVSLKQRQIARAEVVIVVTVEYERTTVKYGNRGKRYALLDAGFAAENLFLQVQTLDLASCVIGAFKDADVSRLLKLPEKHRPILIMTIGHAE